MPTNNVQLIQDVYAAFSRGDVPYILARIDNDVHWRTPQSRGLPVRVDGHGRALVAKWFADLAALDEVLAFQPEEFIDAGEHVVVLGKYAARARRTGKSYDMSWAHVFTVREGKITRWVGIVDNELQAAAHA